MIKKNLNDKKRKISFTKYMLQFHFIYFFYGSEKVLNMAICIRTLFQ